jgi:hypothetical protein
MDTERNKNVKPSISLFGREFLKSAIRNGDVTIERNMTTDVKANERDSTSVTVNTTKKGCFWRTGKPVSLIIKAFVVKSSIG